LKSGIIVIASCLVLLLNNSQSALPAKSIHVGTYQQEVSTFYSAEEGLPSPDVKSVAIAEDGTVYAATAAGVAKLQDNRWQSLDETPALGVFLVRKYQAGIIGLSDNSCESQLTKPAFESVGFTSTCHQPFEGIRAYSGGKTIGMREDKYTQQDHHHHAAVKRNQQAPFGRWGR